MPKWRGIEYIFICPYSKFPEIPNDSCWGQVIQVVMGTLILVWWTPLLSSVRKSLTSLLFWSPHLYSIPKQTCADFQPLPTMPLSLFPISTSTSRCASCPSNAAIIVACAIPSQSLLYWTVVWLSGHHPGIWSATCRGSRHCPSCWVAEYRSTPWVHAFWSICSLQGWCKECGLKNSLEKVRVSLHHGVTEFKSILIPT